MDEIGAEFAEVILQATERDPKRRQQHAIELYRQLEKQQLGASDKLVVGNFYQAAQKHMLNGNFMKAMELAESGAKAHNRDCKRLLAYCLYHESRMILDRIDVSDEKRDEAKKKLARAKKILNQLVFEEDANAQYIRAQIEWDMGNKDNFLRDTREAAEEGSILAKYRYGRMLYYGEHGEIDPEKGLYYLKQAADARYLEAIRILARIAQNDPTIASECVTQYKGVTVKLSNRQKHEQLIQYL